MYLVPTARLELAQLSPLPPQDSVSTNFTTSALRPHLQSGRNDTTDTPFIGAFLSAARGYFGMSFAFESSGSGSVLPVLPVPVRPGTSHGPPRCHCLRVSCLRDIRQCQTGREKARSQYRRSARHEVRRTTGAKQAAGSAAAEGSAHVSALAVLNQHQTDHGYTNQDVNAQYQVVAKSHVKYLNQSCCCTYGEEIRRHQRCATNQTSVNVCLAKKFACVDRLDAAAIKNLQTLCYCGIFCCNAGTN